jgi:UDP-N-acetylglucosamine--N-acetylmuramyl-(pentapeptide) pyrophosphoryl-undecaprenol N-acetylglucosamine transferase
MKKNYLCFVAGKSGGHLLPCITKAKKIVEHNPAITILFFSTNTHLDNELLQKYPFIQEHISLPLTSLAQKKILTYFHFIRTFISSFFLSFTVLYKKKPSKIISMGGSVSLPVCFAGKLLNIPIELFELNAVPGETIKTLAPFSTSITTCFNEAQKHFTQKCFMAEYPLRFDKSKIIQPSKARINLRLDPLKKTIFVLGGSQGSLFINNCVKTWLTNGIKNDIQIIHQVGINDATDWNSFYNNLGMNAFIFSFYDQIEQCYSAADLIICRSGAGTLFEVAFFNKPCITIPLETKSTMHQVDNAVAFKKMYNNKKFIVLRQHELSQSMFHFEQSILNLLH